MSVFRYVVCDEADCDRFQLTTYITDMDTRQVGEDHGWSVWKEENGRVRDYCPKHSKRAAS